MKMKMKVAELN